MSERSGSQTLDRGLRVLKMLAQSHSGMTTSELGRELGLNRVIVNRLLVTLMAHRLIVRDDNLHYSVGPGIHSLVSANTSSCLAVIGPFLTELAEECQATAHLAQADGDVVVVLETYEPKHAKVHIAYKAGTLHPINRGSSGVAILACRDVLPDESASEAVSNARVLGYAMSEGEILARNMIGVSVGLGLEAPLPELSIGVTIFDPEGVPIVAKAVMRTALEVAAEVENIIPRTVV